MATPKEIFDKAILIEDGETFIIPCHNEGHMESVRVMLSRQRKMFLENTSTTFDIVIRREKKYDNFLVSLQKVPRITTGMILSADGSMREVSLEPEQNEVPQFAEVRSAEDARIKAKMLEDGYTKEEVDQHLGMRGGDVCEDKAL